MSMSTASQTAPAASDRPTDVSPELLAEWMGQKNTVLVDVREDFEHAEERIKGAVLEPLSKFDPDRLRAKVGSARVVFHCRSGKRSVTAAQRYRRGDEPLFHLAGGIEAWKQAGRPVERPSAGPRIPVMRQVQITAGSLVALGVALGAFVHPGFLAIAGFVGLGLVFAGVSGWCGMAMLLGKMPWNAAPASASTPGASSGSAASCCS